MAQPFAHDIDLPSWRRLRCGIAFACACTAHRFGPVPTAASSIRCGAVPSGRGSRCAMSRRQVSTSV